MILLLEMWGEREREKRVLGKKEEEKKKDEKGEEDDDFTDGSVVNYCEGKAQEERREEGQCNVDDSCTTDDQT